ncbi:MAG: hypothetical protein A3A24_03085 [Candidatus Buchananbacteria bacterium RIFCSPLOWO2_01_FULL_46_12]|uniref:SHS2 domain-containing protein n=2 Tax=Candidatus Buchananiibacteriota TaxID=1817903 RepID=A0A1G1YNT9_9BACT|nr:MAG: hypothetical protein A2744_02715 [Candidatus Buchananbacteria bacterium RIFCSPHIGHO2_01_FULL_44_11]OGY54023.1 MAG: hypothetical protein A3A24_03085 [Candidatus Buchananbacteria bacterium RIFCSPLOWO2_01_FULL_46_12]
MGLFSSEQSYLGIDFDNNSVKVVQLTNENGRPRLVTYGYIDRKIEREKIDSGRSDNPEVAKIIQHVCRKAKTTTTKVITALPAYSVFSSVLNLPVSAKKDLASAVKWEAKKVIPLPVEDMILDWKVLQDFTDEPSGEKNPAENGQGPNGESKGFDDLRQRSFLKIASTKKGVYTKILLTAAPKDLVKRYINIFKSAGLNLLSLDTESFALVRSLVGNDPSALMIVDIGSVVTNISVVVNGIPLLNRSLDIGGLTITQAIANSLNISLERAEQFKYDIGISPDRAGQGNIPQTIESTIVPIVDELKYSLNLYRNQSQKPIEKVILTGGSSLLLNLPEYLAKAVNLKVYRGDPWARIIYPGELKPVLDEIGSRFSVAIGLAMRNIE